jgi:hypothetical protein
MVVIGEGLLRAAAESFCRPGNPRGCLVVLGAINCMPANRNVQEFMRDQRFLREKVIRRRLRRGVTEGDVPAAADLDALASFYTSVVDGMSIRARDDASRKTLRAIVDCAIAAWDTLVTQHANKQRMRQPQRSGRLQSH